MINPRPPLRLLAGLTALLVLAVPLRGQIAHPLPGTVVIDGPGPVFSLGPDTIRGPSLLSFLRLPRGVYEASAYIEGYTNQQLRQRNRFGGRFYPAGEELAIDIGVSSVVASALPGVAVYRDLTAGGLDAGVRHDGETLGYWGGTAGSYYPTGPSDWSLEMNMGSWHDLGPVSVTAGVRAVRFSVNERPLQLDDALIVSVQDRLDPLNYVDVLAGVTLPLGSKALTGTVGLRSGSSFIGTAAWSRLGLTLPVKSGLAVEFGAGTRGAPEHNLAQNPFLSVGFRYLYTQPHRLDH